MATVVCKEVFISILYILDSEDGTHFIYSMKLSDIELVHGFLW